MITTGIIKKINIDSGSGKANKCLIEIPYFKTPIENDPNAYTFSANICNQGGINGQFHVGDKVYVGFVDNDLSNPVILGTIYQGYSDDFRSTANFEKLNIQNSVNLPLDTKIGDINISNSDMMNVKVLKDSDTSEWVSDNLHVPTTAMIEKLLKNIIVNWKDLFS